MAAWIWDVKFVKLGHHFKINIQLFLEGLQNAAFMRHVLRKGQMIIAVLEHVLYSENVFKIN